MIIEWTTHRKTKVNNTTSFFYKKKSTKYNIENYRLCNTNPTKHLFINSYSIPYTQKIHLFFRQTETRDNRFCVRFDCRGYRRNHLQNKLFTNYNVSKKSNTGNICKMRINLEKPLSSYSGVTIYSYLLMTSFILHLSRYIGLPMVNWPLATSQQIFIWLYCSKYFVYRSLRLNRILYFLHILWAPNCLHKKCIQNVLL